MPVGYKTKFQSQSNEASSDQHRVTCFSFSCRHRYHPYLCRTGVSPDLRSRDCAKSSRTKYDTSGVASVGIGVQQLTWLRSIVFCYAEHRCYASSSSSTRSGAIRTSTTPRQRPGAVCLDHGAQTQPEDAQPHGELPLFDCLCFSRIRRTANPERDPFSAPHAPAFGATS